MSLLNFIIQDKLLVITISVVGALLFLGLLLMVISSVRAVLQRSSDAAADDLEAVTEMLSDDEAEIMLPTPAAAPVQVVPAPVTAPPESNDMQKLLNTVFTDEEYSSRRKALFDSVKPVDAKALAKLANETAARMGVKAKANS